MLWYEALATASAPFVEKGETSTADDATASAPINIVALSAAGLPSDMTRNGTERGISAPRMPVVEAKAETNAPTKRMMMAAILGLPRLAAPSPTHWMMPWRSSIET